MAEAGFNALLGFELVVLGVDEGFALITLMGYELIASFVAMQ